MLKGGILFCGAIARKSRSPHPNLTLPITYSPHTHPYLPPPGIGKVMLSTCTSCNVKYILGGTDKEIPLEFVKLHEDLGSREKKPVEVVNMDASPQRERRVQPKKAEDTSLRER